MTEHLLQQWLGAAGAHVQSGRLSEAEALYRQVLKLHPTEVRALEPLGFLLYRLGRRVEGLETFRAALAVNRRLPVSQTAVGYLLMESGQPQEALPHFEAALVLQPGDPDVLKGRGIVLAQVRRFAEAVASYRRALARAPADPELHYNLGNALLASGRAPDALAAFDEALRLRPQFPEALNNRGAALLALDRPEEAIACFLPALRLKPNFADALQNLGSLLMRTGRHAEAVDAYDRALLAKPDYPYAAGAALSATLACCDWQTYGPRRERVLRALDAGERVAVPLLTSLISNEPDHSLRSARIWIADRFPAAPEPLWRGERYQHERIRLCYLSGDFHEHPVAYALTGVIERHDKSRFEVLGMSFRAERGRSALRARLEGAVDRFIDVSRRGDLEVAQLLRELEVDIAVDLMGHTEDSRTGVFSFRPAPVHVSYLGYPGTLGASYMDYLLADAVAVPASDREKYLEKIIHLPGSYLPNDYRQLPEVAVPARTVAGLPENGFVFCAFNNPSKISSAVFEIWMRLLKRAEGSVLWLSARSPTVVTNLRAEAHRHGVSGDRLIAAPRVPSLADHLARHRHADLFVDTFPYNGHTTAADALWAGVPVVTCRGETMASRAGASLLTAIGLPDLITDSLAAYEEKALALATETTALADVRRRLVASRDTNSLFDTERYCRDLERAYLAMLSQ